MTEYTAQGTISAAFPTPPPFYKSFTAENIKSFQELVSSASQTSEEAGLVTSTETSIDLAALPTNLHNLVPPQLPADGKYRSFGSIQDINPASSVQVIPTRDTLLILVDRLLRQFHRYVQDMARDPSAELWSERCKELFGTFEEVHKLINEYRPHEAREALIIRYEDQIEQVKNETRRVKETIEKTQKILGHLGEAMGQSNAQLLGQMEKPEVRVGTLKHVDEPLYRQAKAIWKMLDSEVGNA